MKSQTSLIASQCRLQQWAKKIHDCQNRPADMQVSEWCEMNGITTANYYYRLRRVREACITEYQNTQPAFVELSVAHVHMHRSLILYPPVRSLVRSSSVKTV